MTAISFTVLGRSQPAGSKRAFAIRKAGVPTGRVAVVDANPVQKSWQQEVASSARAAVGATSALWTGPLLLDVTFVMARPKGHYGTGRNADMLKASAPSRPIVAPDTTKLVRAVEDALTRVLWRDDAQVVEQRARKVYAYREPERCEITVRTMPATVSDATAEAVAA